jgi:hypothetical protein
MEHEVSNVGNSLAIQAKNLVAQAASVQSLGISSKLAR